MSCSAIRLSKLESRVDRITPAPDCLSLVQPVLGLSPERLIVSAGAALRPTGVGEPDLHPRVCWRMTDDRSNTDKTLQQMAAIVAYEYRMMSEAADLLADLPPGSVQHVLALEGFLLHYRNLLDFLSPRNQQPTDIVWSHFVNRPIVVSDEHRWDLNKWLAHLTTERLQAFQGNGKGWPVDQMWSDVDAAWQEFLQVVESEHPGRSAWFTTPLVADGLGPEADQGLYSS